MEENLGTRSKAKVLESTEADIDNEAPFKIKDKCSLQHVEASRVKLPSSSPETYIMRNKKTVLNKSKADFSLPIASRKKKKDKAKEKMIVDDDVELNSDGSSLDPVEKNR